MSIKRGALVVFEGIDRCGKSTQCQRLCTNLTKEGHTVKCMGFPDRTTTTGKFIDAYLKGDTELEDHVIHLLFSANRWEAAAQIREDIAKGITLVIDRYFYSGIVYSVAKCLQLEWTRSPEVGLPLPDLCIYLAISPQEAAKRGEYGLEKYEYIGMQERVYQAYNRLFSLPRTEDVVEIPATMSPEAVGACVLEEAKICLDKLTEQSPLRNLRPSTVLGPYP